jgi:hypothetical protein
MSTILPNFLWWSYCHRQDQEHGLDSSETCNDPNHFHSFPFTVLYSHNSRGFRDQEWPNSVEQLNQAIWCFGDSATVGIGSPRQHTWTYLLEHTLNRRCINISMDGQSNEWIAKKILELVTEIAPTTIVAHWSYTHRRLDKKVNLSDMIDLHWGKFYNQIKDPTWPSEIKFEDFYTLPDSIQKEIREIHYNPAKDQFDFDHVRPGMYDENLITHYSEYATAEQDTENTLACIDQAAQAAQQHNINLVHSFIPDFAPPDQIKIIEKHLALTGAKFVPTFAKLDLARDGHHYDIKTARHFVQQLLDKL